MGGKKAEPINFNVGQALGLGVVGGFADPKDIQGKAAESSSGVLDKEQVLAIAQQLRSLGGDFASPEGAFAARDKDITQQQLGAVGLGRDQALQQIEQTTREGASSRGLFSSVGAISDEAARTAQIPIQESQQRLGILGQSSDRDRQRLMMAIQALSQAGGLAGRGTSLSTGGSPGLGGLIGGAASAGASKLVGGF